MEFDVFSAIFGAVISFVSQILFFALQNFSKAFGRLSIFCKIISCGDESTVLGVKANGSSALDFLFELPLRITVQNNKNIPKTVRDFCIAIYSDGKFCCFMNPVRKIVLEKGSQIVREETYIYNFSISPKSLFEQVCVFDCDLLPFMSKTNIEFRAFYYDEKNIQFSASLFKASCLTQDFRTLDFSESLELKFSKHFSPRTTKSK